MIWTARMAAFFAPSIATVATGMPLGIWTVESSASMPSSFAPLHGTPMTGSVVFAAIAPATCAAMPASAMIQENPLSRADAANSLASFGHRWADNTRTSVSIPYSLSVWIAFSATGRSLVLPIITATFRIVLPP